MPEPIRLALSVFLLNAPYYALCCVPYIKHLQVKLRTLVLMVALTTVVMCICTALFITYVPWWRAANTLFLTVFYVIYFVQYKLYFRVSAAKLLYVFLVVQAFSNMLNVTGKFIDVQFFPGHLSMVNTTSYTLIVLVLLAVIGPFLLLFFRRGLCAAADILTSKTFWWLCITPALFFVLNMVYTQMFHNFLFTQSMMLVIYLLIAVTGLVTYYISLRLVLDTAKKARLESDMRGMQTQLALQAQNYETLKLNIERARTARHDLRHHLSVISAYVKDDDKSGLAGYLADYEKNLPDDAEPPLCQNYAVDVVVRFYLAQAKQAGAEIDVKLDLPKRTGVPDADLCIVFGNVFENAAQSVVRQQEGRRFITARCETSGGKLVLTLDNSTTVGEGHTASHKKKQERGIGLVSVAAVAEKHGGAARFTQENGVYKTSVLLMTGKKL